MFKTYNHFEKALEETAVTRMFLPAPILLIPPVVMTYLEKWVDRTINLLPNTLPITIVQMNIPLDHRAFTSLVKNK